MGKLFKCAAIFGIGWLAGQVSVSSRIEEGEVIHEDDDMYDTVAKSKSFKMVHIKKIFLKTGRRERKAMCQEYGWPLEAEK